MALVIRGSILIANTANAFVFYNDTGANTIHYHCIRDYNVSSGVLGKTESSALVIPRTSQIGTLKVEFFYKPSSNNSTWLGSVTNIDHTLNEDSSTLYSNFIATFGGISSDDIRTGYTQRKNLCTGNSGFNLYADSNMPMYLDGELIGSTGARISDFSVADHTVSAISQSSRIVLGNSRNIDHLVVNGTDVIREFPFVYNPGAGSYTEIDMYGKEDPKITVDYTNTKTPVITNT